MAAYRRVTFDRCGRNSRFDCKMKMDGAFHCWVAEVFERRKKITESCVILTASQTSHGE